MILTCNSTQAQKTSFSPRQRNFALVDLPIANQTLPTGVLVYLALLMTQQLFILNADLD